MAERRILTAVTSVDAAVLQVVVAAMGIRVWYRRHMVAVVEVHKVTETMEKGSPISIDRSERGPNEIDNRFLGNI